MATLKGMKRNCMGTMDFTLKLGNMKKAEDFCTYPIQKGDKGDKLFLQSSHRWAELNLSTGVVEVSAYRKQYANSIWLVVCRCEGTNTYDLFSEEDLGTIKDAVRGTASPNAGSNGIVYCDNSNADKI